MREIKDTHNGTDRSLSGDGSRQRAPGQHITQRLVRLLQLTGTALTRRACPRQSHTVLGRQ